jgi:hypothetical protein
MCFDGDCYEMRYVKITPLYTQYVLKAALYKTPGGLSFYTGASATHSS